MVSQRVRTLSKAALGVAWRQWGAVTSLASAKTPLKSMIDPEGLVLLSLAFREDERRLRDLLAWFSRVESRLLSVQRLKKLALVYPEDVQIRLGEFAHQALYEGGDRRWKSLAGATGGPSVRNKHLDQAKLQLAGPPALVLRLRLGVGVGAKADILGFLIGVRGGWVSVRSIAAATAYSERTVRRAADEMAEARLIHTHGGTPVEYRADTDAWAALLELPRPLPDWRYWQPVWSFVVALRTWEKDTDLRRLSPIVAASQARNLMETHSAAFSRNKIKPPGIEAAKGPAFIETFAAALERLEEWLGEA